MEAVAGPGSLRIHHSRYKVALYYRWHSQQEGREGLSNRIDPAQLLGLKRRIVVDQMNNER